MHQVMLSNSFTVVTRAFNPSTWRQKQVDFCEFKAQSVKRVPGLLEETLSPKETKNKKKATRKTTENDTR